MKFNARVNLEKSDGCYKVKPLDLSDVKLFEKLLQTNKDFYNMEISTPVNYRTYDQLRTVWKLVTVIFQSQNERSPTEDERYALYEDLLEEYAEKRPSTLDKNKLVPVHISKADTKAGAYFIEGLMCHLSQYCDLNTTAQTEVRELLFEWEEWRGTLTDKVQNCTMEEYRERHPYSEASGKGGTLHLHHIVTKGSCEKLRNVTANWLMLTPQEHENLHQYGYGWFERTYPHLKGKIERAFKLQGELNGKNSIV